MIDKVFELQGHLAAIYALCNLGNGYFLSGGGDGLLIKWNVSSPEQGIALLKTDAAIFCILFDEVGKSISIFTQNGRILQIDIHDFTLKSETKGTYKCAIYSAQRLKNGRVVIGMESGEVKLLGGQDLHEIQSHSFEGSVRRLFCLENGNVIVALSNGKLVELNSDFEKLREIESHSSQSINGLLQIDKKIIIGGRDAKLRVYNELFQFEKEIDAHWFAIYGLVDIGNGFFISASRDKTMRIWDSRTMESLTTITKEKDAGHSFSINTVLFIHDKEILISAGDDKKLILWKLNQKLLNDSFR